jgi:prepilin-type N-terminal cleavage/methylation domain-containing protein/prepilin-type processing-associated H-X9-DG protein
MKTSKTSGFTLVELLVVISIIALLASLAIPMVGKARNKAVQLKDTSNLKQVGLAIKLYASDYDGNYPILWSGSNITDITTVSGSYKANDSLRALFATGICKDERIFNTPGAKRFKVGDNNIGTPDAFTEALATGEESYTYVVGQSESSDGMEPLALKATSGGVAPAKGGAAWTAKGCMPSINEGKGLNVLYCDGSVSYFPKNTKDIVTFGSTNVSGAFPLDPKPLAQ